jgi:hypothetical protein
MVRGLDERGSEAPRHDIDVTGRREALCAPIPIKPLVFLLKREQTAVFTNIA